MRGPGLLARLHYAAVRAGTATMPDDADDRRQEAMLLEAEALMARAEAMLLTRGERWTQLRLRRVAVIRPWRSTRRGARW